MQPSYIIMSGQMIIRNEFIETLMNKYINGIEEGWEDDNSAMDIQTCKYHDDGTKKTHDLLRIIISCHIDELKDIFHNLKGVNIDQSISGFVVRSYINNSNPDTWAISKLFPSHFNYSMVIEVYRGHFSEFLGKGCIVDLSDVSFI